MKMVERDYPPVDMTAEAYARMRPVFVDLECLQCGFTVALSNFHGEDRQCPRCNGEEI